MPKKLTTAEWVDKAQAKHGDKYDYSLSIYTHSSSDITVVCPDHGPWQVNARSHYRRGVGCPVCLSETRGFSRRLSTDEFIQRARVAHGDRYDYSQSVYTDGDSDITVGCRTHGPWQVMAKSHIYSGVGCPECNAEAQAARKRLSPDEYIRLARRAHRDKYDYTKTRYTKGANKVTVTCPEHGDFSLRATNHINGKRNGCPSCGLRSRIKTSSLGPEQFLLRAKEVHGDLYDYSQVIYKNAETLVTIGCSSHGLFEQTPHSHLKGHGCRKCSYENKKHPASNTDVFIEKAKSIHGDRYRYDRTEYVHSQRKVEIYCTRHQGYMWQTPALHLAGRDCFICTRGGGWRYLDKPAIAYYLRIEKPGYPTVYKVGVTTQSLESRFRDTLDCMTVLAEFPFDSTDAAWRFEQSVLHDHAMDRYTGRPIIKGGNFELFTEDVLGLDTDLD